MNSAADQEFFSQADKGRDKLFIVLCASGFESVPRPAGGFAESPAFRSRASWMPQVAVAYDAVLRQLVWGECPTLGECLRAVVGRGSHL